MIPMLRSLAAAALVTAALTGPAHAGSVHTDVPGKVDPKAFYVIYLHGARPETHPVSEPHPQRGPFEYEKIVNGLAARGVEVISEVRTESTNPRRYVRTRVVPQVQKLIAGGVRSATSPSPASPRAETWRCCWPRAPRCRRSTSCRWPAAESST